MPNPPVLLARAITPAVIVAVWLVVALIVTAVIVLPGTHFSTWRTPALAGTPQPSQPAPCGGWDCALQTKFEPTASLVAAAPGSLGIVIRDRTTGQVWQAGAATRPIWTASTIKLAIIADLMVRARAGQLTITQSMRDGFDDMLAVSANRPATNLWATHGGEAALQRYRTVFGMTGVHFPTKDRLWGALKATADDLAALMSYVLEKMHPDDRAYIVDRMRRIHQVQQWGVWSAGPAQTPGAKAGWNVELDPAGKSHWVLNSVGFAGPNERYVVSVMYELRPGTEAEGNTVNDGLLVISNVVATAFGGAVPAKVPPGSLIVNPPTSA